MDSALLCLSLTSLRSRSGLVPSALAFVGGRSGGAWSMLDERCGRAASPAAAASVIGEAGEERRVDFAPRRRGGGSGASRLRATKPARSSTRSDATLPTRTCASTRSIAVRERVLRRRADATRRDAASARVERTASSRPRPRRAADRSGGASMPPSSSLRLARRRSRTATASPRSTISGSCSRMTVRSVSASHGGRPASPPIAGSRNAGAIASTSASTGSADEQLVDAQLHRERVGRQLRGASGSARLTAAAPSRPSRRPCTRDRTRCRSS